MKVVAFNGSGRKTGNTNYALEIVGDELEKEGIEVEFIQVGNKNVRGCASCFHCMENKTGQCVIKEDKVNEWIAKIKEADGIILGSPTYYGNISGTMKNFLDRAFFSMEYGSEEPILKYKVGAAVVAVRRSGGFNTYNALNDYFLGSEMIVPGSSYWNIIHGMMLGEAKEDEEGKQTMRVLGQNMAYLLKMKEAAKDLKVPEHESKKMTNFIR
ncbi:flavodoxin family protein [Halanaerobaculum tunisiense]